MTAAVAACHASGLYLMQLAIPRSVSSDRLTNSPLLAVLTCGADWGAMPYVGHTVTGRIRPTAAANFVGV